MSATDQITFATGLVGGRPISMAKRVHVEGGRITAVDDSAHAPLFRYREEPVDDLISLMRAVWGAAHRGEIAVRGKPVSEYGRRAIYPDPEKGPAGLTITPRYWVAFDWDSLPLAPLPVEPVPGDLTADPAEARNWQEADPLHDAEVGVEHALVRLPPAFRNVSCGWQISASAGFKPGTFRLRTWHWLDSPCTGEELKFWCKPAIERQLLDPATLVEAQPHYLGVRLIGGDDPCPARFGIRDKSQDAVKVPDIAGMKRRHEAERAEQRARERARFRTGTTYRAPGGPGRAHPAAELSRQIGASQPDPERARLFAQSRIDECLARVRNSNPGNRTPTFNEEAARAKWYADQFDIPWEPVRDDLKEAFASTMTSDERKRVEKNGEGVLVWLEKRAAR